MAKTIEQKQVRLKEKRKFKDGSSLARIEDRITELELRLEELENGH